MVINPLTRVQFVKFLPLL